MNRWWTRSSTCMVWAPLLILCTSCYHQQAFLYVPTKELDVQSMEIEAQDRWPERMVAMVGTLDPCPGAVLDRADVLTAFEGALGTSTTILERGDVKEAILEEWKEQMSGLYDESTTAEWGHLAGADGVAMLDVTCREGIQVHIVTVSDAESGQRLFSENYVGGEWGSAMRLLTMEFESRDRLVRHPLDGLSESTLRDSTFNFFVVDELGAVTWQTGIEAVMQRSLDRFKPTGRLNFNDPIEVELDLHPMRGASMDFHVPGLRSDLLERHFRDASSAQELPPVPTFSGVKLHATANVAMPFAYYYDPRFPMRVRLEGAEGPQEVRDALRSAPAGNYEFEFKYWRLGTKESNETRLLSARPRSTGGALALSAVAPGLGMEYVTFGARQGGNWFLAVMGPAVVGLLLDAVADRAYEDYLAALTPAAAESSYRRANRFHKGAFVTLGISGVLWGWNIYETRRAAENHRLALRQFIER